MVKMYPQSLVESIVAVATIKARLKDLHSKITSEIAGEDDEIFEEVIEDLINVHDKLMTAGVDIHDAQQQSNGMRKVTINETGSSA